MNMMPHKKWEPSMTLAQEQAVGNVEFQVLEERTKNKLGWKSKFWSHAV